jgi:uncharacterized protein
MFLAKFQFVDWLVSFLESQDYFLFEWDQGNSSKNLNKHCLGTEDIEACFADRNILVLGQQYQPETKEGRYGIIARVPHRKKILFVCFTIREGHIRPISARVANKKEREFYEK